MRCGFFTIIIIIVFPFISQAQESVDIGEVEVRSSTEHESQEDIGAFTTVIKPSELDTKSKSIAEAISETVGVDSTSLGGEGSLSTVSIRGSSSEQVAVFLDGVKLNSSTYGSVDFASIPPDSIERIEIIRGNASARFGTDAIGGVINIVTKKVGAKRAIDLKLTGASFETLHTSESWREPRDGWNFVLSHTHESTAGDYTFRSMPTTLNGTPVGPARVFTRIHNASISEDVLTKFDFDLAEKFHLSVSSDFYWNDKEVPGTEEETTLLYPADPLEAQEEIFRDTAGVKLTMDEFFVKNILWETGITYLFDHDHYTNPSPPVGNPIDVTYIENFPIYYTQWVHSKDWKDASLSSTFRYQYGYDRAQSGINHTRQTNAIFVEENLALLKERLFAVPQLRFEKATERHVRFSGKVGIIGKPHKWVEIKSNIGNAFRYPNFSELYFPDQGYLRGNPDLNDELSWGWDLGFVFTHKYFGAEFSYFQNRIDNQILFVPISALTIQPINTYAVFSQGIEIAANIDPIKYLHFDANYTWLDAHFKSNGLQLPGRPRNKANLRVEVRVKPVTAFGEVQIIGSFPVNVANTVRISGHTAVNLGATLNFAKHFFFTFEVKDMTDVQIYDARAFPLPRRSFWGTLGAKV